MSFYDYFEDVHSVSEKNRLQSIQKAKLQKNKTKEL